MVEVHRPGWKYVMHKGKQFCTGLDIEIYSCKYSKLAEALQTFVASQAPGPASEASFVEFCKPTQTKQLGSCRQQRKALE